MLCSVCDRHHHTFTGDRKWPSSCKDFRSWCEVTLYLSHFTTSLFITDRRKWMLPRGDVTVNSPDDLSLLRPPSLFLSPARPTVSLPGCFFPLKLLQLELTNYQHVQSAERSTERGGKYKSQSASAALFSCAILYRSLLQIFCCCFYCMPDVLMKLIQGFNRRQAHCGKNRKERMGEVALLSESQCNQSVSWLRPSRLPSLGVLLLSAGSTSRPGVLITGIIH